MNESDVSYVHGCLRRAGIRTPEAVSILSDLRSRCLRSARDDDWDALVSPLAKLIRGLQSTKCRWGVDPQRAPLFDKYLKLLLVTRQTIRNTETTNAGRKRLPELAQEMGLRGRGTRWQDWVPSALVQKVVQSFDRLYTITLPAAYPEKYGRTSGKRLVPFRNKVQLAASDKRWDNVLLFCVTEKSGRSSEAGYIPYIECLDFAIDAVLNREPGAEAPLGGGNMAWEKLLDAEHKAKYKEWADTTLLGLDTINLEPARKLALEQATQRATTKAEKAATKRAKDAAYARDARQSKKADDLSRKRKPEAEKQLAGLDGDWSDA